MRNFDGLHERLLREGIAPRHVRRYLAELRHHHDDLLAEEQAHGVTGPAAKAAARARLGSDDELAAALLARPRLRSMSAKYPWLMFGILPPLVATMGFLFLIVMVQKAGIDGGAYIPRQGFISPVPAWYVWAIGGTVYALNFLIVPLLGALMAWTAQRQRMNLLWPLLGMALILALGVHGDFHVTPQGELSRSFGSIIPLPGLFRSGGAIHAPVLAAQTVLMCLPLVWLWRARRQTAS